MSMGTDLFDNIKRDKKEPVPIDPKKGRSTTPAFMYLPFVQAAQDKFIKPRIIPLSNYKLSNFSYKILK